MTDIPNQGILIVGTGARTPLGFSAPATAAAVRAGVAAMKEHPFMIDKSGESMVVAADALLPAQLGGVERLMQLALSPAYEAIKPLIERNHTFPPIHLLISLPEDRPGRPENIESIFSQQFASHLAEKIGIQKVNYVATGHAGGLTCMEHALSLITSGKSKLCLVGGVDSYLAAETLEWLDNLNQLHSESTIWGFLPWRRCWILPSCFTGNSQSA